MSLELLLAVGNPISNPIHVPLVLDSSVHVHFDGNSHTAPHLTAGLDEVVWLALGSAVNGATRSNSAVSGRTWQGMTAAAIDVDAAWVPGKTNVLVIAEHTNSAFLTNRTVMQIQSDQRQYIDRVRSAHPWIILQWFSPPRGHCDPVNYPNETADNIALVELQQWSTSSMSDIGVHATVDTRTGIPQYDHDGSNASAFTAYQDYWHEVPGSGDFTAVGWCHPLLGTWTVGNTIATGKRAWAERIAIALTDGRLPSTP